MEPYNVTDCSVKILNSLMSKYASYSVGEVVSSKRENGMGQQYFEFCVDEEDLSQLVLWLFYAPKE